MGAVVTESGHREQLTCAQARIPRTRRSWQARGANVDCGKMTRHAMAAIGWR